MSLTWSSLEDEEEKSDKEEKDSHDCQLGIVFAGVKIPEDGRKLMNEAEDGYSPCL